MKISIYIFFVDAYDLVYMIFLNNLIAVIRHLIALAGKNYRNIWSRSIREDNSCHPCYQGSSKARRWVLFSIFLFFVFSYSGTCSYVVNNPSLFYTNEYGLHLNNCASFAFIIWFVWISMHKKFSKIIFYL